MLWRWARRPKVAAAISTTSWKNRPRTTGLGLRSMTTGGKVGTPVVDPTSCERHGSPTGRVCEPIPGGGAPALPRSPFFGLAAGTGNITRLAARHADRLTAVDASPETLAINSDKLGAARNRSS